MTIDPLCANCAYESAEVSDRGLCDNCDRAYQLGYEAGVNA